MRREVQCIVLSATATWGCPVEFSFRIHARRADGTANRRFHKVRYTAALRFGVVLPSERGFVELSFEGQPITDVEAHGENRAYEGRLRLDDEEFANVVAIVKPRRDPGKVDLITFWPRSQHQDAHQSYTDPLVDTALDGTPFDIHVVATRMYEVFRDNAGASPATLMKLLYEEEAEALQEKAQRLGELLEESFEREREASVALEKERAAREVAEKERDVTLVKLAELKSQAYLRPPDGTKPDASEPVTLERVSEGWRGRRAILLHMSDGTERANNWPRGFEARLEYAKRLEGRRVRTDAWGGYSWKQWFQNIYPVDE